MKKHKILNHYRGGIKKEPIYGIVKDGFVPIRFYRGGIKKMPMYEFEFPDLTIMSPAFRLRAADICDERMATATQTMIDKMMKEIDGSIRSALIYGTGFTSFNTKPPMPLEPLPEQKPNRFKALGFSPILQVKNIPIHAVIAQA